jgi:hypothetical protein
MQAVVSEDSTTPVQRVYDAAADANSEDDSDTYVASFDSVRSRVQRYRAQYMPAIPAVIEDVEIDGQWRKTWKKERFLIKLDNDWGIAVFTTRRMLTAMQAAQCLYLDGTFCTAPRPYMQMVTIHGMYLGFVIPLAFCLLTGKNVGQYRQVLRSVKRAVLRVTGQPLLPGKVVLDFEHGLILAVETEFPLARAAGCYFHFTQSLWRHVQEVGLAGIYKRNGRLRKLVRCVMAIAFLPVLIVRQNFMVLRRTMRVRRLVRRFPQLDEWLDYVEATYIRGNAPFPPVLWNVYNRDVNTRTNNHVEGMDCLNKYRKAQRSFAERRFIHALIHEAEIVPRYTNLRE